MKDFTLMRQVTGDSCHHMYIFIFSFHLSVIFIITQKHHYGYLFFYRVVLYKRTRHTLVNAIVILF